MKGEKQLESDDFAKRLAIHEAGHAVMSFHFGEITTEIFFDLNAINSYLAGHVRDSDKLQSETKKIFDQAIKEKNIDLWFSLIRKLVLPALGGIAAVYIYDGKGPTVSQDGASEDLKAVKDFLSGLKFNWSVQDIINEYLPDAIQILEEKWQAVEALSNALIENMRIDGNEVKEIINNNLKC